MTVVGARPQFVKAAVLSRLIRGGEYGARARETLVHTGQHYDENMSEVFFRDMEIPKPDVNLNVGSGGHGAMTGRMLEGIEGLILERKPDILLVYGDTNSTLAGALAASKLHVPVAHVEAGLRSYMMAMPEEQNRRLSDQLSSWLFCPTEAAVRNLAKEGIANAGSGRASPDAKAVLMSGDIMLDASLYYREKAKTRPGLSLPPLPDEFYLLTMHRAENTDDPERLGAIVSAINAAPERKAVCPLHPRTRKLMAAQGLSFGPHVTLLDPVGYYEMLYLEDACSFVLTDSGGVQKEAYFFKKPCVTLRDSTEWVELVDCGWNTLVGADRGAIEAALRSPTAPDSYPALYGNGNAGRAILDALI
jgi:UDP-GlcNAc3NAcA epimerase